MNTKTIYPHTLTQTSETNTSYREFNNLNNVKNNKNTYAKTGQIASKSGTHKRPSTVTATNFQANIPTGSTINSVTVEYKADYDGNITIGKSTVDLTGVTIDAKYGKALTSSLVQSTVKFTSSNLTVSKVNSSSFGVKINFPANTKADVGYVRIQYIRIKIDYTAPNYTITASKVDGTYTNDEFLVNVQINNKNKTSNDSKVTITLPSGVSYLGKDSGDGSISSSGSTLTWTPGVSSSKLSRNVTLRLKITTDGSHSIKFTEAASGHSKTLNINTTTQDDDSETPSDDPKYIELDNILLNAKQEEEISFSVDISPVIEEITPYLQGGATITNLRYSLTVPSNCDLYIEEGGIFVEYSEATGNWVIENNIWTGKFLVANYGLFEIPVEYTYNLIASGTTTPKTGHLGTFYLNIQPSTESELSTPYCTILSLSKEELDRLGDGYSYTVQTYLKVGTSEAHVRDWYKNFRIGVFNNPINKVEIPVIIDGELDILTVDNTDVDSLTAEDLVEHAEYWSSQPKNVNAYESLTAEFVYDSDYPLYILIVGDYTEADTMASIKYTEPCIIENHYYNGWETNGNHPTPINATIDSETLSNITVPSFSSSNTFIVYEPPITDLITDNYFVKGVSIDFDIDYTDYLSLNVKLNTGNGTGERSVILDPTHIGTITLGDSNDRWGLTPTQLTRPEEWEYQIQIDNVFSEDSNSEVRFNNITLNYYIVELENQLVSAYVEGENLAIYDTFIDDVDVPAGLETDTKLINIDGTDLNDAYLQNIREKTITLKLAVSGCNLEETTRTLQELAALLTNERDELNRPIPKRLDLSIYPGIHWEYILTDPIDNKVEISDYETTIKLVVPSGTAYTNEAIVTSTVGKINGIAKVNPIIQLIPLNTHIEVLETYTDQKWTMNYTGWSNTDNVTIDCENRTVILTDTNGNTTDITSYVDYGVDWFKLLGEFEFQPTNCIIQTVTRTERK